MKVLANYTCGVAKLPNGNRIWFFSPLFFVQLLRGQWFNNCFVPAPVMFLAFGFYIPYVPVSRNLIVVFRGRRFIFVIAVQLGQKFKAVPSILHFVSRFRPDSSCQLANKLERNLRMRFPTNRILLPLILINGRKRIRRNERKLCIPPCNILGARTSFPDIHSGTRGPYTARANIFVLIRPSLNNE